MTNKLNYTTLHFTIDDLELLQKALKALQLQSGILRFQSETDNINRLYHAISIAINDDTCNSNSQSKLMNS
jgi:hypothetical protein